MFWGFFFCISYILELNIMANNVAHTQSKLLLKIGSNDCHSKLGENW